MIVGVPTETYPGEKRVAVTPAAAASLIKSGVEVMVEAGAGLAAGFIDADYTGRGAKVIESRPQLFDQADVIAQVRTCAANPEQGAADVEMMKPGQIVVGHAEPLTAADEVRKLAEAGVSLLAMELVPRITRAQSMDALSSQASLAGYRCVLLAGMELPKIFPMMMTAAGTIKAAKVFVVGAGVAGLQAVATAKRLGAQVSATDVRAAVKDQVESLGGKFVFLEEIVAEGEGGYARELTDEQKNKQQELVADAVAESDVVITTAAIPGRKAPEIVTEQMVRRMAPGTVIVDMAAERGGNCALTRPDETVVTEGGVTILGPTNIPAQIAHDASQTYARNISTFLDHLIADGEIRFDLEDEITRDTLVCHEGEVLAARVRESMGLEPKPDSPERGLPHEDEQRPEDGDEPAGEEQAQGEPES